MAANAFFFYGFMRKIGHRHELPSAEVQSMPTRKLVAVVLDGVPNYSNDFLSWNRSLAR